MIFQAISLLLIKNRLDRNIRKLYKLKKGHGCGGSFIARCVFPAKISAQEGKVRNLWSKYKELMKDRCAAKPVRN